jgi:hypothetical protein
MNPWGALCAGLAAAACGGVAHDGTDRGGVPTPAAGGTRDGGSASGGAGGVAGWSSGGSAFAGGTAGVDGSVEECGYAKDYVRIEVQPVPPAFDGGGGLFETTDYSTDGRVGATSLNTFEVSGCPANAICDEQSTLFTVDALGLDVSSALPLGALVHVHYKRACGYGCTNDIAVTSLDSWGGYVNAAPAKSGLYLAADDGGGSMSEMPYRVNRILLPCDMFPKGSVCSENPGLYKMEFDFDDASWVVVSMGEERPAPYRQGLFSIRNLRSFETGYCDDYTNWAHWVVNADTLH